MAIHLRIVALAAAACPGMANLATPARAAEIVVVCSGAMTEILGELAPMFERATGHKVVRTFHPKGVVAAEIRSDMQVDLLLTNPDLIEDLVKEGKVVAVSGQNFVQSFAGVAVRAGAPKPDVSTVEGFKNAMLAAKTVSYSVGPSGLALVKMLERLGIGDQVKAKAVVVKPGERVGEYVAQGPRRDRHSAAHRAATDFRTRSGRAATERAAGGDHLFDGNADNCEADRSGEGIRGLPQVRGRRARHQENGI